MIFTVIQNEWLATNSRNAILNNFDEYYKNYVNFFIYFTDFKMTLVHFLSIQNMLTLSVFIFS